MLEDLYVQYMSIWLLYCTQVYIERETSSSEGIQVLPPVNKSFQNCLKPYSGLRSS